MKFGFRLATLFLSINILALCQVDRATLTGTVRDPSGAVVADAKVSLRYPATGLTRAVASNASGAYLIGGLPVGAAVLEIQKPGFRKLRSEIELNAGETKTRYLAVR